MSVLTRRRAVFAGVVASLAVLVGLAALRVATIPLPAGSPVEEAAPDEPAAKAVASGTAPGTEAAAAGVGAANPAAGIPEDTSPAGLLVAAARAGDAHCVRELLAAGVPADSESRGYFAIHRAARSGSVAVLRLLVAAGAHVEALDQFGNTALTRAAFFGNADAVAFLVSVGANPNAYAEPNNLTPLRAILSGWTLSLSRRNVLRLTTSEEERYQAARALIEAGADPHFDAHGHPPPVVLARGLGGEIGRLYASVPEPAARPR